MNGTNNSEASLNTNEISSLDSRLKNCEDEIVGQEHRLLEVFRNVYRATVNNEWTANRKMGAWGALFRYVFFGRPAIVLTLGVGGFLALHANFLFFEQNKKLDLQNHLAIVDSYLVESQRNNQLFQLFPLLLDLSRKKQVEIQKYVHRNSIRFLRRGATLIALVNVYIVALSDW